ncbi:MAG: hypothetical protein A4E28_02336 [Methanocella sp. PtaU1.Bin125]|nr:MAG: hypothetical protein A4E28_02336 [Methanocella sp. PtaU1.Bin125]
MHGDHRDPVADERLRKDLPVVTTQEAVDVLKGKSFTSLYPPEKWEQAVASRGDRWLRVASLPGKHGSPFLDVALPSVMGSMLEWGRGRARSAPACTYRATS